MTDQNPGPAPPNRNLSEPDTFRAVYRAYFPRIYAYVAYRVGRQQDAEDIVADVFLRAADHATSFDYRGEEALAGWLFQIARSQVAQFYRRHKR
ncbi:MAG: hypothetical protein GYB65_05515, partial [Chloroflexi bacterium]|nr:hypothetical protein [Chloroflexota bacterium]